MKDLSIIHGGAVVTIDLTIISMKPAENLTVKSFTNDPTEINRKKVNNAIKELRSAGLLNERKAKKLQFKKQKHRRFICF